MKKGFTKHDAAILRLVAKSCIPNQSLKVIQLKGGEKLGSVAGNLERIAAAIDALAKVARQLPTNGEIRNFTAEILDVVFNGRPAPR